MAVPEKKATDKKLPNACGHCSALLVPSKKETYRNKRMRHLKLLCDTALIPHEHTQYSKHTSLSAYNCCVHYVKGSFFPEASVCLGVLSASVP